ncbi:phosphatidylinositol N-acetylglucosaminyltransferase subunit P-like [Bactrocera neohumeralis]|uniref:phosphatidylinositol N-acetylglucosaminyltransferase subunit P-like n=1 Tax=Bactrocera neohumeralis TaxID=98809 RepID=UPI00216568C8|nr:phosphatidylinositol N-acetylglucosaminyltransferase subunit P-like [Bactrocera neohumeralis]
MWPVKVAIKIIPHIMPNPAPTSYRAIQGFACYLCSVLLFTLYIIWVLAPLKQLGFQNFPYKYLALCMTNVVSCFLVMIYYVFYPAINLAMTPNVDEISAIIDVKLLTRGNELEDVINWKTIKHLENVQRRQSKEISLENKIMENCRCCKGAQHEVNVITTIPTLYHIDLAEINRLVYD